jgi:hypothetical protein
LGKIIAILFLENPSFYRDNSDMEEFEIITAKGSCHWPTYYQVELFTSYKSYIGRFKTESKEILHYGFRFRDVENNRVDVRFFQSESERLDFLINNVSNLQLLPMKHPKRVRLQYLLDPLVGKKLTSVLYVMDYLQIDICGNRFTYYYWPNIQKGMNILEKSNSEYLTELDSLIDQSVIAIDEYLDTGLTIEFADNTLLFVPLKVESANPIPEIVEFHGQNGQWMIWQVGDEPYK